MKKGRILKGFLLDDILTDCMQNKKQVEIWITDGEKLQGEILDFNSEIIVLKFHYYGDNFVGYISRQHIVAITLKEEKRYRYENEEEDCE